LDHLITLKIIVEENHSNKTNLLCCIVDIIKAIEIILRTNLCKSIEEMMAPFDFMVVVRRLYENFISKLRTIEGWSEETKCNIRVK